MDSRSPGRGGVVLTLLVEQVSVLADVLGPHQPFALTEMDDERLGRARPALTVDVTPELDADDPHELERGARGDGLVSAAQRQVVGVERQPLRLGELTPLPVEARRRERRLGDQRLVLELPGAREQLFDQP